jgi:hypothetical protein
MQQAVGIDPAQMWQAERLVPVQMWQGVSHVAGGEPSLGADAAGPGARIADSEVHNRTQGTLGYVRVPASQGSDCSSVVGYAHSTTLWSTPVQSVVLVRAA